MATTPTLTVRLPDEVRRKLALRAQRERVTVGQYARRILWDHVEPTPAHDAGESVHELGAAGSVASAQEGAQ